MTRPTFWANVLAMLFVLAFAALTGWLMLRATERPGAWHAAAYNQALAAELYDIQTR